VVLYRQFAVAVSFWILLKPLGDGAAKVVSVGISTHIVCAFLTVVKYNNVWLLLRTVLPVSMDRSYYSL
jgi:hypothetical protein